MPGGLTFNEIAILPPSCKEPRLAYCVDGAGSTFVPYRNDEVRAEGNFHGHRAHTGGWFALRHSEWRRDLRQLREHGEGHCFSSYLEAPVSTCSKCSERRKVVSENPWTVSQPQPSVGPHFLSEKGISFLVFRVTMAQGNWGNSGTLSPTLLRIHGGH